MNDVLAIVACGFAMFFFLLLYIAEGGKSKYLQPTILLILFGVFTEMIVLLHGLN